MRVVGLLLLFVACGDERPRAQPPPSPPPSAATAAATIDAATVGADAAGPDFNARVLALIEGYRPGGGYAWPAPGGTHGTTRDLSVAGERFARSSNGPTHCSGLTFEVFWRALQAAGAAEGFDRDRARELMRRWFVPEAGGQGPADALAHAGLGRRITDLEQARPGDFVQVWMNNGRGHTVIFLGWERDESGAITGIHHFSSHPATDGIGTTTRAIGSGPRDIDRRSIFIARAELGG